LITGAADIPVLTGGKGGVLFPLTIKHRRKELEMKDLANSTVLTRRIFWLAWPVILEMALHMFVWVFDTAMVGRLSAEALSAVGLGGEIVFTTTAVFSGIGIGTMVMVARHTGAGLPEDAQHVASRSLGLGFLIGLLVAGALALFCRPLLQFFVKDPTVTEYAVSYMRITSVSVAFMIPLNVCSYIMRGVGNTRTPMIIAGITNGINVIGDYVLIFGKFGFPRLEVMGASIATATGQIIGSIIIIAILFHGRKGVRVRPRHMFQMDKDFIKRIFRLSIPASMEEFTRSGGRVISSLWISSMGAVPFAANSIAITAESISFMPGHGFAIAASTLVGQSLGAGMRDEAEESALRSTLMGTLFMTVIGLGFFFFPTFIIALFTNLPDVMALAVKCIRIGAFEQPFIALSMIMAASLRGAGDTRGPFVVAVISNWLIRLPLIFMVVYVLHLEVTYVWVATLVQFVVESMLLTLRFYRGRWRDIDLETI
jgi:putative MATE family efflux protein